MKHVVNVSRLSWLGHCPQESEPEVVQHLEQMECPALQLGLPWIMTAFAGHLAVGEVLLLWDRIIAFDSLLLLPVLAVAVLAFRRQVGLASGSVHYTQLRNHSTLAPGVPLPSTTSCYQLPRCWFPDADGVHPVRVSAAKTCV